MKEIYSAGQTLLIVQKVFSLLPKYSDKATVLCLYGDLGAGKTSLTQEIALQLGVSEKVLSPTFVIAKWYETKNADFEKLVHIDAYRIESDVELNAFKFSEILNQPKTLVVIEWPENIKSSLKKVSCFNLKISHDQDKRIIESFK